MQFSLTASNLLCEIISLLLAVDKSIFLPVNISVIWEIRAVVGSTSWDKMCKTTIAGGRTDQSFLEAIVA